VQKFENRLRFDTVTHSLKVGTFLRHSIDETRQYKVLSAPAYINMRLFAFLKSLQMSQYTHFSPQSYGH